MSDFNLQPIGSYEFSISKKGEKMLKLRFEPKELAKVKEWDLSKVYIYKPSKDGGKILGIIKNETNK